MDAFQALVSFQPSLRYKYLPFTGLNRREHFLVQPTEFKPWGLMEMLSSWVEAVVTSGWQVVTVWNDISRRQ